MKLLPNNISIDSIRRRYNTSYLFNILIYNPYVIVICHTQNYTNSLDQQYSILVDNLKWYNKLYRKIKKIDKIQPIFISISNYKKLIGNNRPILFDTSCMED